MRTLICIALLSAGAATAARAQADTMTIKVDSLLKVKEKPPGLLKEAKVQPLDAQHIALAKYPEGKIVGAEITRRSNEIVYVFRVERTGHRPRQVLVSATTGEIINTIPKPKSDTAKKTKPPGDFR